MPVVASKVPTAQSPSRTKLPTKKISSRPQKAANSKKLKSPPSRARVTEAIALVRARQGAGKAPPHALSASTLTISQKGKSSSRLNAQATPSADHGTGKVPLQKGAAPKDGKSLFRSALGKPVGISRTSQGRKATSARPTAKPVVPPETQARISSGEAAGVVQSSRKATEPGKSGRTKPANKASSVPAREPVTKKSKNRTGSTRKPANPQQTKEVGKSAGRKTSETTRFVEKAPAAQITENLVRQAQKGTEPTVKPVSTRNQNDKISDEEAAELIKSARQAREAARATRKEANVTKSTTTSKEEVTSRGTETAVSERESFSAASKAQSPIGRRSKAVSPPATPTPSSFRVSSPTSPRGSDGKKIATATSPAKRMSPHGTFLLNIFASRASDPGTLAMPTLTSRDKEKNTGTSPPMSPQWDLRRGSRASSPPKGARSPSSTDSPFKLPRTPVQSAQRFKTELPTSQSVKSQTFFGSSVGSVDSSDDGSVDPRTLAHVSKFIDAMNQQINEGEMKKQVTEEDSIAGLSLAGSSVLDDAVVADVGKFIDNLNQRMRGALERQDRAADSDIVGSQPGRDVDQAVLAEVGRFIDAVNKHGSKSLEQHGRDNAVIKALPGSSLVAPDAPAEEACFLGRSEKLKTMKQPDSVGDSKAKSTRLSRAELRRISLVDSVEKQDSIADTGLQPTLTFASASTDSFDSSVEPGMLAEIGRVIDSVAVSTKVVHIQEKPVDDVFSDSSSDEDSLPEETMAGIGAFIDALQQKGESTTTRDAPVGAVQKMYLSSSEDTNEHELAAVVPENEDQLQAFISSVEKVTHDDEQQIAGLESTSEKENDPPPQVADLDVSSLPSALVNSTSLEGTASPIEMDSPAIECEVSKDSWIFNQISQDSCKGEALVNGGQDVSIDQPTATKDPTAAVHGTSNDENNAIESITSGMAPKRTHHDRNIVENVVGLDQGSPQNDDGNGEGGSVTSSVCVGVEESRSHGSLASSPVASNLVGEDIIPASRTSDTSISNGIEPSTLGEKAADLASSSSIGNPTLSPAGPQKTFDVISSSPPLEKDKAENHVEDEAAFGDEAITEGSATKSVSPVGKVVFGDEYNQKDTIGCINEVEDEASLPADDDIVPSGNETQRIAAESLSHVGELSFGAAHEQRDNIECTGKDRGESPLPADVDVAHIASETLGSATAVISPVEKSSLGADNAQKDAPDVDDIPCIVNETQGSASSSSTPVGKLSLGNVYNHKDPIGRTNEDEDEALLQDDDGVAAIDNETQGSIAKSEKLSVGSEYNQKDTIRPTFADENKDEASLPDADAIASISHDILGGTKSVTPSEEVSSGVAFDERDTIGYTDEDKDETPLPGNDFIASIDNETKFSDAKTLSPVGKLLFVAGHDDIDTIEDKGVLEKPVRGSPSEDQTAQDMNSIDETVPLESEIIGMNSSECFAMHDGRSSDSPDIQLRVQVSGANAAAGVDSLLDHTDKMAIFSSVTNPKNDSSSKIFSVSAFEGERAAIKTKQEAKIAEKLETAASQKRYTVRTIEEILAGVKPRRLRKQTATSEDASTDVGESMALEPRGESESVGSVPRGIGDEMRSVAPGNSLDEAQSFEKESIELPVHSMHEKRIPEQTSSDLADVTGSSTICRQEDPFICSVSAGDNGAVDGIDYEQRQLEYSSRALNESGAKSKLILDSAIKSSQACTEALADDDVEEDDLYLKLTQSSMESLPESEDVNAYFTRKLVESTEEEELQRGSIDACVEISAQKEIETLPLNGNVHKRSLDDEILRAENSEGHLKQQSLLEEDEGLDAFTLMGVMHIESTTSQELEKALNVRSIYSEEAEDTTNHTSSFEDKLGKESDDELNIDLKASDLIDALLDCAGDEDEESYTLGDGLGLTSAREEASQEIGQLDFILDFISTKADDLWEGRHPSEEEINELRQSAKRMGVKSNIVEDIIVQKQEEEEEEELRIKMAVSSMMSVDESDNIDSFLTRMTTGPEGASLGEISKFNYYSNKVASLCETGATDDERADLIGAARKDGLPAYFIDNMHSELFRSSCVGSDAKAVFRRGTSVNIDAVSAAGMQPGTEAMGDGFFAGFAPAEGAAQSEVEVLNFITKKVDALWKGDRRPTEAQKDELRLAAKLMGVATDVIEEMIGNASASEKAIGADDEVEENMDQKGDKDLRLKMTVSSMASFDENDNIESFLAKMTRNPEGASEDEVSKLNYYAKKVSLICETGNASEVERMDVIGEAKRDGLPADFISLICDELFKNSVVPDAALFDGYENAHVDDAEKTDATIRAADDDFFAQFAPAVGVTQAEVDGLNQVAKKAHSMWEGGRRPSRKEIKELRISAEDMSVPSEFVDELISRYSIVLSAVLRSSNQVNFGRSNSADSTDDENDDEDLSLNMTVSSMKSVDENDNIESFLAKMTSNPEGASEDEIAKLNYYAKKVSLLCETADASEVERMDVIGEAKRDGLPADFINLICDELFKNSIVPDAALFDDYENAHADDAERTDATIRATDGDFFAQFAPAVGVAQAEVDGLNLVAEKARSMWEGGRRPSKKEIEELRIAAEDMSVPSEFVDELISRHSIVLSAVLRSSNQVSFGRSDSIDSTDDENDEEDLSLKMTVSSMKSVDENDNIEAFLAKMTSNPEGASEDEISKLNYYAKKVSLLCEAGNASEVERMDVIGEAKRDGLPADFIDLICDELFKNSVIPDAALFDDNENAHADGAERTDATIRSINDDFFAQFAPAVGVTQAEVDGLSLVAEKARSLWEGDRRPSQKEIEELRISAEDMSVPAEFVDELISRHSIVPSALLRSGNQVRFGRSDSVDITDDGNDKEDLSLKMSVSSMKSVDENDNIESFLTRMTVGPEGFSEEVIPKINFYSRRVAALCEQGDSSVETRTALIRDAKRDGLPVNVIGMMYNELFERFPFDDKRSSDFQKTDVENSVFFNIDAMDRDDSTPVTTNGAFFAKFAPAVGATQSEVDALNYIANQAHVLLEHGRRPSQEEIDALHSASADLGVPTEFVEELIARHSIVLTTASSRLSDHERNEVDEEESTVVQKDSQVFEEKEHVVEAAGAESLVNKAGATRHLRDTSVESDDHVEEDREIQLFLKMTVSSMRPIDEDANIESFITKMTTDPEGASEGDIMKLNFYSKRFADMLETGNRSEEDLANLLRDAKRDGLPVEFFKTISDEVFIDAGNGATHDDFKEKKRLADNGSLVGTASSPRNSQVEPEVLNIIAKLAQDEDDKIPSNEEKDELLVSSSPGRTEDVLQAAKATEKRRRRTEEEASVEVSDTEAGLVGTSLIPEVHALWIEGGIQSQAEPVEPPLSTSSHQSTTVVPEETDGDDKQQRENDTADISLFVESTLIAEGFQTDPGAPEQLASQLSDATKNNDADKQDGRHGATEAIEDSFIATTSSVDAHTEPDTSETIRSKIVSASKADRMQQETAVTGRCLSVGTPLRVAASRTESDTSDIIQNEVNALWEGERIPSKEELKQLLCASRNAGVPDETLKEIVTLVSQPALKTSSSSASEDSSVDSSIRMVHDRYDHVEEIVEDEGIEEFLSRMARLKAEEHFSEAIVETIGSLGKSRTQDEAFEVDAAVLGLVNSSAQVEEDETPWWQEEDECTAESLCRDGGNRSQSDETEDVPKVQIDTSWSTTEGEELDRPAKHLDSIKDTIESQAGSIVIHDIHTVSGSPRIPRSPVFSRSPNSALTKKGSPHSIFTDIEQMFEKREDYNITQNLARWNSPWDKDWVKASPSSRSTIRGAQSIGGVAAAKAITVSRWSPRIKKRQRIPTTRIWKKSYEERTKAHPGYFKVDVFSIYSTSRAVGATHPLDSVPWENRDVKQRFLHEKSVSLSRNWFGDLRRKRGNDRVREPVAHPKSMIMPIENVVDKGDWNEEWYTTWQSRKDLGDEMYDSYTYDSESITSSFDDSVSGEYDESSGDEEESYDDEDSYTDGEEEDEEPPECGSFRNVRQKIGERVSRVHPAYTSSLRRSRWRKKYFPRGTFPY